MNRKRKSKKSQEIAYYYFNKNNFQSALKNFHRAIGFKNSRAYFREENYYDIAYCYEHLGDLETAYEYIQKSLKISGGYINGKKYLGNLLILMGKQEEGDKILKECEKLEEDIQNMPLDLDVFYGTKTS